MDKIHDKQFCVKFGVKFGDNEKLKLSDKDAALVSKLFRSLQDSGDIIILEQKGNNNIYYGRKK